MAEKPILRVGLLMDGPLKAFQAEILRAVQASDFAQVVLVIDERGLPPSLFVRADRQRRPLLLEVYRWRDLRHFDRPGNPLRDVEDADILRDLPTLVPGGRMAGQIADVLSHDLDVLLYLGGNRLGRAARLVAKSGAWSLRTGSDGSGRDETSFFLDLCDAKITTAIALNVATNDIPAGTTVVQASFSARRNSWLLNCAQPYWSAVTLVTQNLEALHKGGLDRLLDRARPSVDSVAVRPNRGPSNLDVARWWAPRLVNEKARRVEAPTVSHWRIATRVGRTPPLVDCASPDLTGFRVQESPLGHYYADPFLLQEGGQHWLFFEDYLYKTKHGSLACAPLSPDGSLGPAQTILDRPYHLSYPCLLRDAGELYMLPETLENGTIELYRCARFPDRWELVKVLLPCRGVDSTLFKRDGVYWLFTSILEPHANGRQLHLFYAHDLLGPWSPHPANPLSSDIHFNRGGGGVVMRDQALIRPSQDCGRNYGYSFSLNEISRLTTEEYAERCRLTVEPTWAPGLTGCHTYSLCGNVEAIDLATVLPRSLVAPDV